MKKPLVLHLQFLFSLVAIGVAICSCSKTTVSQWQLESIITRRPCFNSGRILFAPQTDVPHIELEIVRSQSGMRFYINLILLSAKPCDNHPAVDYNVNYKTDDCKYAHVNIVFANEEKWDVYPRLLAGWQRLLLADEVSEALISRLCAGDSFNIYVNDYQIAIVAEDFVQSYEALLAIPI